MRIGILPGLVVSHLDRNTYMRSFFTKGTLRLFTLVLVCATIGKCQTVVGHAATRTVTAENPAAKRGALIFHQRCERCHNKQPDDATPFGPPNLYQVFRHKTISVAQATQIIHHGKGPMPAFGTSITNTQIRDVIAYLSAH